MADLLALSRQRVQIVDAHEAEDLGVGLVQNQMARVA